MLTFETPNAELGYSQADQSLGSECLDSLAFTLLVFLSVEWLAHQYLTARMRDD
jgi:hypothetical protein